MKRYGLVLATIGMLLLTVGVLQRAGWLARPSRTAARAVHAGEANSLASPAGWRYRQNQPHHWRYCVLHN